MIQKFSSSRLRMESMTKLLGIMRMIQSRKRKGMPV
uniref:Uncharacterized protein n=1 Tax=Siphoviridae sp. ct0zh2 TaxID=2825302 RepID=A0A8S5PJY5_9CAUD|nr:MAG TPA: hypothetical protein [Siphoviridae sp. ct0zh2]